MRTPASLDLPVVNTPESFDSPVMSMLWSLDSLWWIHRGVDFLVYFEQASEQVYKYFLVNNRPGSQDFPVY